MFISSRRSRALPPASVSPSRLASFLSGRMAIRLPPPFTQFVNIVTCASVSGHSPRITTSYAAERRRGHLREIRQVATH